MSQINFSPLHSQPQFTDQTPQPIPAEDASLTSDMPSVVFAPAQMDYPIELREFERVPRKKDRVGYPCWSCDTTWTQMKTTMKVTPEALSRTDRWACHASEIVEKGMQGTPCASCIVCSSSSAVMDVLTHDCAALASMVVVNPGYACSGCGFKPKLTCRCR